MRQAHPDQYNADLAAEVGSRDRVRRWTTGELEEMARLELDYNGTAVLDYLAQNLNRPREGVKKKRYTSEYTETLRNLRDRRAEVDILNLAPADEDLEHSDEDGDGLDGASTAVAENIAPDTIPENVEEPDLTDPVLQHILSLCYSSEDRELISVCQVVCTRAEGFQQAFDSWVENTCRSYGRTPKYGPKNQPRKPERTAGRRRYRAQLYQYMQRKFSSNPKQLANELIDGMEPSSSITHPDAATIEEHYKKIFSEESPTDENPVYDFLPSECKVYSPITNAELLESVQKMGKTTGGPDGIDSIRLARIPIEKLEVMANLMILAKYVPSPLRKSRTILIPKTKENLEQVGNWRPITISSILLRLVNKIIAKRLSKNITLDECQRGFVSLDGCFANNITLQSVIKGRRLRGKPFAILALDIQRAFDGVSHHTIRRALRRFRVDENTTEYIMATYKDQFTTIFCGDTEITTLQILRGVKQGDPLAPILFNMVMDELISSLKVRTGVRFGETSIPVLGYADDLLLLAENTQDAQFLLNIARKFLEARHLTLNPAKCRAISMAVVPSKKKLFLHTTPKFYIGSTPIPPTRSIGDAFKYLGFHFSCQGATPCSVGNLFEQLSRIQTAPLKPQQKVHIIKTFLIPRYIHAMQSPSINIKILKKVDLLVRQTYKRILKLPSHIIDEALYTPTRLGGLGLFSFARRIPVIMRDRLRSSKISSPLFASFMAENGYWDGRVNRMIRPQLNNKDAIDRANATRLEGSFYGGGISQAVGDNVSNHYINSPPSCWSGEDYVRAIKLRTNTLPTRGLPYGPREAKLCRGGCGRIESLCHVLQRCYLGKGKRLARHNFVVKRICTMARAKGWEITEEPNIRDLSGRLHKPDMVCVKENEVVVADVGVSWEGPRVLGETYDAKRAVYNQPDFVDALRRAHPEKRIEILPFIIGARGIWCRESSSLLEKLSINTQSNRRELVITTIRGSCSIHIDVMRKAWDG